MMDRASFAPVDAQQRIGFMDVLRACALLGILLVNIEWFTRPWQEFGNGVASGLAGLDHAAAWGVHVFVAGKFWVLFSLLFGMGFAVMMARAEAAGRPFRAVYLRRTAALLVIGIAHALLLWAGDILHTYALAALLLLALRDLRPRTQLVLGLSVYYGLCVLTLLGAAAVGLVPGAAEAGAAQALAAGRGAAAEAARVYAEGGFAQVTAQRAADFTRFLLNDFFVVPMALGVFLVGSWLLRSGRIGDIAAQRPFFLRLAGFGLPVGLGLSLWAASIGVGVDAAESYARWLLANALMSLGALPLALGYLALLALAWSTAAGTRALGVLAPAGRMALSNYLLQSLVGSLVFYGYGLALWGRIGHAGLVLLAVAVFVLQVAASRWWLMRFRFGPVEWLWRWATYGRRPRLRQDGSPAA
ncbi:DUF418 domain-containing protein [Luteimonas suaedae]|uniref:DUF418 domain-containing protein n=1 Tax=Luteimonas suaedae TaxID=2605430 RepID=UPI002104949E|nr:DUF418 domain-containing protein [Luteimonas suaedae]